MTASKNDLQDFVQFAEHRFDQGATGSLQDLVIEWESQRTPNEPSDYPSSISSSAPLSMPEIRTFEDVRKLLALAGHGS